jgi:lipopolysaccharide heptosyltransferase II
MKPIIKSIYLNLRKLLLDAIFIFVKKSSKLETTPIIKKILFIRIDRIGDIVLSTPALKAIKQAFPHSELTALASPSNSPLVFNNPNIDHIVVYDRSGRLIDRIRVIQKLRESGFDFVIDPYPDYELETALIAFFSGAMRRIGYASYGREVFFNLPVPEIRSDGHFIDLTLDILKPVGIVTKDKTPEIYLTGDEKKWAGNWLKERRLGTKPVVGIHPGAYYESQRWPPENFAELICELRKAGRKNLILFGGPGDERLLDSIVSMSGEDILTYIPDDFRKFAALLSFCSVFICNNSGPLHIAVALNTPTISFMGPTQKKRWMPIGDIHKVLRINDLPCIGCNLGYCKIETHDCMRLISVAMVIHVLKDML